MHALHPHKLHPPARSPAQISSCAINFLCALCVGKGVGSERGGQGREQLCFGQCTGDVSVCVGAGGGKDIDGVYEGVREEWLGEDECS